MTAATPPQPAPTSPAAAPTSPTAAPTSSAAAPRPAAASPAAPAGPGASVPAVDSPGRDRGIDVVRAISVLGVVGGHWLVTGLVIGDDGAWRQASPLTSMPALAPVSWVLQTLALLFFAGGFGAGRSRPATAGARPRFALSTYMHHLAGRRTARPPAVTDAVRGDPSARRHDGAGHPTDEQHNGAGHPTDERRSGAGHPTDGRRDGVGHPTTGRRGVVGKLAVPVGVLLAGWAVVLVVATVAGVPFGTRRTIAMLVISPLWFLLPYLVLRAVTGPLARVVDRVGPFAIAAPAAGLVALSDAGLLPMWVAVPAAWCVPWVLGIAVARRGRAALPAGAMIITGIATLAFLIVALDYPVSAVGVPGDGRSNLSPPSLFAVALGLAQIGTYLLVARLVDRRAAAKINSPVAAPPPPPPRHWVGGNVARGYDKMRRRLWTTGSGRPRRGRPNGVVGSLNRAALPIYLGHQTVLVATVGAAHLIAGGPVDGLLSAPAGPPWIFARVAWLPFLALVLVVLIRVAWPATRRSRAGFIRD